MEETRTIGKGVKFERIRRITGYLVGSMDRWNSAKRAEESQRVKHGVDVPPASPNCGCDRES